ncbi:acyl-CoA synthetase (AMP-forming)/AMP-acid ligase II [Pseudomonas protegens]|uniref:acyl-CoA synthetase n=1 Tax=Pseudomonas protegens TaxID=380021 RepID=UPI003512E816
MLCDYQDVLQIEAGPQPFADINNTYALIERSASQWPQAPALSFFLRVEDHARPVRWTYAQLLTDITRAANLFERLGVRRGDVVALILPNLPQTHIAMWGAQTAGIAFAVNVLLDGTQMAELLATAKVRWIVTVGPEPDAQIWQRVEGAIARLPGLQGVLAVDPMRHLPGHGQSAPLPAEVAGVPVLDFFAELALEPGERLRFAPPGLNDVAAYYCTGGTTGLPKIARHSQRNEVIFCGQLDAVIGAPVLRPGRTVLTALPLFHVNALIGCGLAAFAQGGHVLLAPPAGFRTPGFMPRFWEIVETHQVSSYSAVPTVYAGLLQVPCAGHDTSSLTVAICGAAPMPRDLLRKFEQQTGQRILEGYGLTEGTCASSVNPARGESRIGSVGLRLPWQDMRVMILDERGAWLRDAQVDEVGAICISGPNVFIGYLDSAHDQGAWFDTVALDGVSEQRWFNTGDLGRCDGEGYFWLTGRKKELIIRGGHNIEPKYIEEVLATHPDVALCAAVGRPDAHAGEVPVAYVQVRAGSAISSAQLLDYATRHISERAAVPKAIILADALPVTGVGKIFKPALVMAEIETVIRQEAALLAIELQEVRVVQSARQGLVASYRCADETSRLAEALSRYTFVSERS